MFKPKSPSALAALRIEALAGFTFFAMLAVSASAAVIIDPQIYVQQTTVGNAPNSSNLIGGEGNAITSTVHPPSEASAVSARGCQACRRSRRQDRAYPATSEGALSMGPGTAKTSGDGTTPPPYRVGPGGGNVGWTTERAKV